MNANTSLDSICRTLKLTIGSTDNGDNFSPTPRLVGNLIAKLFPVAQRSSVLCTETQKTLHSYKTLQLKN